MKKLLLLLGLCLAPHAHAKSMEALDLLKLFAVDKKVDYNLYDWTKGSEHTSPIQWQTVGIDMTEIGEHPFYRTGHVVVTNQGKVTHKTLGQTTQNGHWVIRLLGVRNGFTTVEIYPHATTHDEPQFQIDKKYITQQIQCENDASYNVRFDNIKFADKKAFWLKNEYSSGSAGGATHYTLLLNDEPKCGKGVDAQVKKLTQAVASSNKPADKPDYTVTYNDNGAVLTPSKGKKLYLGKSCDAYTKPLGEGTWSASDDKVSVKFKDKTLTIEQSFKNSFIKQCSNS